VRAQHIIIIIMTISIAISLIIIIIIIIMTISIAIIIIIIVIIIIIIIVFLPSGVLQSQNQTIGQSANSRIANTGEFVFVRRYVDNYSSLSDM